MWRTTIYAAAIVVLVGTFGAGELLATTWTVEKDGTGDYTVIQDAVDAASSGDIILIGSGRYDEYETYTSPYGLDFDIHVYVPDDMSLTFRGVGPEATIIGPSSPNVHSNLTGGFWGRDGVDFDIGNLSVVNCNQISVGFDSGALRIENCWFTYDGQPTGDTFGISGGYSGGAVVVGCRFEGLHYGIRTVNSPGGVSVANCDFVDCAMGIYAWTSNSSITVSDSNFECNIYGIGFLELATGTITRCVLQNCVLGLDDCGNVGVYDSQIIMASVYPAVWLDNDEPVTLVGNIFSNSVGPVLRATSYGLGTFRDNHILATGSGYSVYCPHRSSAPTDLDLSGNYWGTTDLDEIAASIWDCHDDGQAYHCVIFEPIADGPVPIEPHTWTEVKQMFRPGGR